MEDGVKKRTLAVDFASVGCAEDTIRAMNELRMRTIDSKKIESSLYQAKTSA